MCVREVSVIYHYITSRRISLQEEGLCVCMCVTMQYMDMGWVDIWIPSESHFVNSDVVNGLQKCYGKFLLE